jgi:hypothetical protein
MKGMSRPKKESKKPSKLQKPGKKISVPKSPKRNQVYPQQP